MTTFGARLRELRNERKIHQSTFGDIFGLSASAIGSYERNEREPAYKHLVEFAKFYNVSLDFLLCRTDERLTAEDYAKKKSYEFDRLLQDYDITVKGYELTDQDKKTLSDVSIGLFWKHLER